MALTVGRTPRRLMLLPDRVVEFSDAPQVLTAGGDEPDYFAGITFSKITGVGLHVAGSDPQWVRSTFNELKTELSKNLPWWRFLRKPHMWTAYFAVAAGIGLFALEPSLGGRWLAWIAASLGIGLVFGSLMTFAARRLLPGFEIVTAGTSGKGPAVLGMTGALLLQVAIGVAVNLATK